MKYVIVLLFSVLALSGCSGYDRIYQSNLNYKKDYDLVVFEENKVTIFNEDKNLYKILNQYRTNSLKMTVLEQKRTATNYLIGHGQLENDDYLFRVTPNLNTTAKKIEFTDFIVDDNYIYVIAENNLSFELKKYDFNLEHIETVSLDSTYLDQTVKLGIDQDHIYVFNTTIGDNQNALLQYEVYSKNFEFVDLVKLDLTVNDFSNVEYYDGHLYLATNNNQKNEIISIDTSNQQVDRTLVTKPVANLTISNQGLLLAEFSNDDLYHEYLMIDINSKISSSVIIEGDQVGYTIKGNNVVFYNNQYLFVYDQFARLIIQDELTKHSIKSVKYLY